MEPRIRPFNRKDIAFALAQTEREGWDPTTEYFETGLAHDPAGAFIAEMDGGRVGLVTTTAYRATGWIGNLIVPPEQRSRGIGRRLMAHALAHLADCGATAVRLEADPPGIKLYRSLGFADEFESPRFRLEGPRAATASAGEADVVRITPDDLPAVAAFDAEFFGEARARLLGLLLAQARGSHLLRTGGQVRGYALAVPSRFGLRIGPWVAEDAAAAGPLLRSMLAEWPDATVILALPGVNRSALALLDSFGFHRRPSSFRMVRGPSVAFGRPEHIYAIANGAMG
jgi:ribosomal protein S18 acetylase RimI-like enzyme